MRPHAHLLATAATLAVLAGCANKPQVSAQQESGIYLSRAGRSYTPPGSAGDPWGPYVTEASAKYDVPQRWIREVMRQESGGRLYSRSGAPITSSAGAMGLMQVMPGTYDELRVRYPELGDDPFDPHNNIMAGTAYIREMYDIYGAPGFLAAYNAGPGRLDDYLTRSRTLPEETRRYVAIIGPKLGSDVPNRASPGEQYAMNRVPMQIPDGPRYAAAAPIVAPVASPVFAPVPAYSTPAYSTAVASALNSAPPGALVAPAPAPVQLASAYVPGGPIRLSPQPPAVFEPVADPIQAAPAIVLAPEAPRPAPAFMPVQVARLPEPPQPAFNPSYAPPPRPVQVAQARPAALPLPPQEPPRQFAANVPFGPAPRPLGFTLVARASAEPIHARAPQGTWAVQVGAFANEGQAANATASARGQAPQALGGARTVVAGVRQPGGTLYRARLTGLSRDAAAQACERLARTRTSCMVVSPDA